jgi:dTDP-glucose 4,6-dehydratase
MCGRLLVEGFDVLGVDSLLTGDEGNLASLRDHPGFTLEVADVSEGLPVGGAFDAVIHMASPASPVTYARFPLETLRAGSAGTHATIELAASRGARFLLASTSEIYGDPLVHPQTEGYWGNVNPAGPRSMYDEAKRYAEAVAATYLRSGLDVKVVRIFNTYGPRMAREDGRAVPAFIDQALRGLPITVHGDGSQTRSLCYVDDLIDGIFRLLTSEHRGAMNMGNPDEITIRHLAERIRDLSGTGSEIVFVDRPADDPERRCPDISLARSVLGWEPKIDLEAGLRMTLDWARAGWVVA